MQAFEWRIWFLISYKTQTTESIDSVFYVWCERRKVRSRELNSSRSSRASTERPFAEFAHPILERGAFEWRIKFHISYKTNKERINPLLICLVRETGIEPVRSPTRPSNVRVCLFRHSRIAVLINTTLILYTIFRKCQYLFWNFFYFLKNFFDNYFFVK